MVLDVTLCYTMQLEYLMILPLNLFRPSPPPALCFFFTYSFFFCNWDHQSASLHGGSRFFCCLPLNVSTYSLHCIVQVLHEYLMLLVDTWWYSMQLQGTWWYLLILDDIWWYFMVLDETLCYAMQLESTWWYLMVLDVTSCYTMQLEYLMILPLNLFCRPLCEDGSVEVRRAKPDIYYGGEYLWYYGFMNLLSVHFDLSKPPSQIHRPRPVYFFPWFLGGRGLVYFKTSHFVPQ